MALSPLELIRYSIMSDPFAISWTHQHTLIAAQLPDHALHIHEQSQTIPRV